MYKLPWNVYFTDNILLPWFKIVNNLKEIIIMQQRQRRANGIYPFKCNSSIRLTMILENWISIDSTRQSKSFQHKGHKYNRERGFLETMPFWFFWLLCLSKSSITKYWRKLWLCFVNFVRPSPYLNLSFRKSEEEKKVNLFYNLKDGVNMRISIH